MLQIKTFHEPLFPIFADILAQISDPATDNHQHQSIEVPEKVRSLYALNASRKQMLQRMPLITLSIEELGIRHVYFVEEMERKLIILEQIKLKELMKVKELIGKISD